MAEVPRLRGLCFGEAERLLPGGTTRSPVGVDLDHVRGQKEPRVKRRQGEGPLTWKRKFVD